MRKTANLPPKEDQLAWCREARVQNAEALRAYERGNKRKIIDGEDMTQQYIQMLRGTIATLEEQITDLEKHA